MATLVKLKSKHGSIVEYEITHAERILKVHEQKSIKGFTLVDTNYYFKDNKIVRKGKNTGDSPKGQD